MHAPTLLLYDGDCNVCVWAVALIVRHDTVGALRPLPIQSSAADELLADPDDDEKLKSWHAVTPDGVRRSGGDAFPTVFGAVPRLKLLARLASWTPAWLRRVAYRLVADRRVPLSRLVPLASKKRARDAVDSVSERYQRDL